MKNNHKQGVINAVIAYTMWGIYPLYWRLLQSIGPTEILINRMLWSFFTLGIVIVFWRLGETLKSVCITLWQDKKKLFLLIAAAALLGINWFIFTYSIVSGQILEASLGYYINPIFSILIGVIFLKEKLNNYQILAAFIATIGVAFLTVIHGALPWISLALAVTFGFYGLAKKLIGIDPFFSLFLETVLMLPVSAFFFSFWLTDGTSAFLQGNLAYVFLLIGAGFITTTPLYFFSKAAGQLPLKTLGFLQYIGPTLQLLVAIFITGEYFSTQRLLAFAIIWVACILFSTSHLLPQKQPSNKSSA